MQQTYQELRFSNDFIFCKVMQSDPELCKELIELIIGRKVDRIITDNSRQSIKITAAGKGVRLDVYLEDDDTVYDIEMQTVNRYNLPKRSRYYQGMIDLNLIQAGSKYEELKATYIVFIETFDLFGKGLHKYTFRNACLEQEDLELGDGSTKIFLNASGTADDVSEDLKAFLKYVASGMPENDLSRRIEDRVRKVKSNEEWEVEYMTLEQKLNERLEEGIEIGREKGRADERKDIALNAIKQGFSKEMILQIMDLNEDQYNEYLRISRAEQVNTSH